MKKVPMESVSPLRFDIRKKASRGKKKARRHWALGIRSEPGRVAPVYVRDGFAVVAQ